MNENSGFDKKKLLFTHLITMLSMSAMQQMGKLKNPVSGKIELQLQAAQITIDLLDMLEEKTKGNLDQEEARLLKDTLSSLKLNYVETEEASKSQKTADSAAEKADKQKEASGSNTMESAKKTAAEPSEIKDGTEKTETPDQGKTEEKPPEQKESKFHKSYE